jgi:curved DNA-binding protein CbpA
MTIHKKLMMIVSCLAIGSWVDASVAPVSGSLSQYGASYAPKAMPAWSNAGLGGQNMQMPQATLDPEVLNSVMTQMNQNRQFMNQRIRPNQAISGRGFGAFRSTGANLMRATSPVRMSKSEAANILGVDQNASDKDVKKAYQVAAKKAHPDLGGSHEKMQKVNEAKDALLNNESDSTMSSYQQQDVGRYKKEDEFQKNDNSELYQALKQQNIDDVMSAIKNGANVNERYPEKMAKDPEHPSFRMVVQKKGISTLALALENFEKNPTKDNFEIIKLLLDFGANPNASLDLANANLIPIEKVIKMGNDELFDLFVSKNVQFNDDILQFLALKCTNSTPHMVDVILPSYKGKELSPKFLSEMLYLVSQYNILEDRSRIVDIFLKNGYQFNLDHLFYGLQESALNFKILKSLLLSDLSQIADDGSSINSVETYSKVVKNLEKLKEDIDKPTMFGKKRKYILQDLNEALDLANNRLNQVKNETSFMNRMNNAFKGGMSSMWRQNK